MAPGDMAGAVIHFDLTAELLGRAGVQQPGVANAGDVFGGRADGRVQPNREVGSPGEHRAVQHLAAFVFPRFVSAGP